MNRCSFYIESTLIETYVGCTFNQRMYLNKCIEKPLVIFGSGYSAATRDGFRFQERVSTIESFNDEMFYRRVEREFNNFLPFSFL